MTEYIDREALEARLNERYDYLLKGNGPYDHYTDGYEEAVSTVEDFPSAADVAPVVHGRWVVKIDALGREYTVCSVCNSNFRMKQDSGRWLRIDLRGFEYCPHCGAKMDGGADGDE